jgi:hypothetical protein
MQMMGIFLTDAGRELARTLATASKRRVKAEAA